MRFTGLIVLLGLGIADTAAAGTCLDKLNEAVTLADKLPPSAGRVAVLRDIGRARDSRHEGDEAGCLEQINETLAILREYRQKRSHRAAAE
ncbi:MAG: hypothetical protein P4M07_22160 [Xanthobacteraceae bacterium]|nr:hypothetical protein [Xanthobacteraceae bacterium]